VPVNTCRIDQRVAGVGVGAGQVSVPVPYLVRPPLPLFSKGWAMVRL